MYTRPILGLNAVPAHLGDDAQMVWHSCIEDFIMGMASHSGPWLLGTQKNTVGPMTTAGAQAGQVRNMGATHSIQFKTVAYGDTTAQTPLAVVPAGACIQSIAYLTTTSYTATAPTFAFFVNGTAINTAAAPSGTTAGTTGRGGFTLGTSNPALVGNVGTTDALVSFTQVNGGGTTGAGILEISYIVRNSDGSIAPTSSQA